MGLPCPRLTTLPVLRLTAHHRYSVLARRRVTSKRNEGFQRFRSCARHRRPRKHLRLKLHMLLAKAALASVERQCSLPPCAANRPRDGEGSDTKRSRDQRRSRDFENRRYLEATPVQRLLSVDGRAASQLRKGYQPRALRRAVGGSCRRPIRLPREVRSRGASSGQ